MSQYPSNEPKPYYGPPPPGYNPNYYTQQRPDPFAIGCLGLIGLFIIFWFVQTNAPQPFKHVAVVGEKVSLSSWDLVVTTQPTVTKTLKWSDLKSSTANGTFLVVPVDITFISGLTSKLHSWDFKVSDSHGKTYKISEDMGAYSYSRYLGGQDISDNINPDQTVRIYLVFDIDPAARGLKLIFMGDDDHEVKLGI